MRPFLVGVATCGIVAVAASAGFSQATPSATVSLEGVWKATSVIVSGQNAADTIPNRQPNINIFTKKYYSRITADGPTRRVLAPPKDPNKLTNAEKLARYEHWRQVAAASGAYEVKGTKWFQYPLVGKDQSPEIIARNRSGNLTAATAPVAGQDIRFADNTLVLIQTSADGKTVTRRMYTRLEPAAGAGTKMPIEGVWKATSTITTGANTSANPKRQPNIFIYTKGYFSIVRQDGGVSVPTRPVLAPPKNPVHLTDAEKLARYEHWAPVAADAGRYEVKGTTLYQYDLVAMNQTADMVARNKTGNMGTVAPNSELKFEGNNTMVQTTKSADGKSETRRTYTRLE